MVNRDTISFFIILARRPIVIVSANAKLLHAKNQISNFRATPRPISFLLNTLLANINQHYVIDKIHKADLRPA